MKARSNCKRCGIEFEDNNEAVECIECDCLTLCEMCARDNACCIKKKISEILSEKKYQFQKIKE